MILILLIFLFSFSFSEIIDHQIPNTVSYKSPLNLKVYTDYSSSSILQLNIYYRSGSSGPYMMAKFTPLSSDYYSYTIPAEFLNSKYIEYYILLETNNNAISIPEINPQLNPLIIGITKDKKKANSLTYNSKVNILSPLPNSEILESDIIISLSYFQLVDLDIETIKIFVDKTRKSNLVEGAWLYYARDNKISHFLQVLKKKKSI